MPDIIAITQTRLKNSMNFGIRLQGYSIEYHDSPTNARVVAVFVKESLAYHVKNKFILVKILDYNLTNSNCKDFQDDLYLTIDKLSETISALTFILIH